MKAAVQNGYGSPDLLQIAEIDKPVAGDDGVLVRVGAASVNAADWHLMSRMPHIIGKLLGTAGSRVRGFDLAGLVEATGKNVTRFKPGDEVFGTALGAFAEFAATTENRLAPKPQRLTFEQAAAIPVAGLTALQGLRDNAHVRPGQRVLVYGAGGGVGTFAVQIAKALGAHVTAVTSTGNLDLVRSIGADEVIDYTKEDFARRGPRYDVVFDVGANRSLADCRRALTPGGTLVIAGAHKKAWVILLRLIAAPLLSRLGSRRITPVLARMKHDDLMALKELAEVGKLSPVIDRRYALSEAPDALRRMGTGQARGKIVISIAPLP